MGAREIKVQTLWELAKEKSIKSGIVTWPVTYHVNMDYLVPENLTGGLKNPVNNIRKGSTPGLFDELLKGGAPESISSFETELGGQELDILTTHLALNMIKLYLPAFMLMHFLDADHRQHFSGVNAPESIQPFEFIGGLIGQLRDAVAEAGSSEKTSFIIVGYGH